MIKLKSFVCVEVNGKEYEFSCAPDSALPDAIEASSQINAFLLGRMEQARLANEKNKPEETPEVKSE